VFTAEIRKWTEGGGLARSTQIFAKDRSSTSNLTSS